MICNAKGFHGEMSRLARQLGLYFWCQVRVQLWKKIDSAVLCGSNATLLRPKRLSRVVRQRRKGNLSPLLSQVSAYI